MKAIADTGFIVGFGNRSDAYHEWAVGVAGRISTPLIVCEAVLTEATFHLKSAAYVLSLLDSGLLQLDFDLESNRVQIGELARRYRDQSPDLADLCVLRMSELNPLHTVVTVDEKDFRVFRRNKREAVPLLCPRRH